MPRKPPDDPVFDAFWAAYPVRRPNPRERARTLFNSLIKRGDATAQELTDAARAYAAEVRGRKIEPRYQWMASTFLAGDRWLDYVPAPQAEIPAPAAPVDHPLAALLPQLGDAAWRSWIAKLTVERPEAGPVIVTAPTRFAAAHIRANYAQAIETLLGEIEVKP